VLSARFIFEEDAILALTLEFQEVFKVPELYVLPVPSHHIKYKLYVLQSLKPNNPWPRFGI